MSEVIARRPIIKVCFGVPSSRCEDSGQETGERCQRQGRGKKATLFKMPSLVIIDSFLVELAQTPPTWGGGAVMIVLKEDDKLIEGEKEAGKRRGGSFWPIVLIAGSRLRIFSVPDCCSNSELKRHDRHFWMCHSHQLLWDSMCSKYNARRAVCFCLYDQICSPTSFFGGSAVTVSSLSFTNSCISNTLS